MMRSGLAMAESRAGLVMTTAGRAYRSVLVGLIMLADRSGDTMRVRAGV